MDDLESEMTTDTDTVNSLEEVIIDDQQSEINTDIINSKQEVRMADLEFKMNTDWVNPFDKCRNRLSQIQINKEMTNTREKKRLNRLLQNIFEYGYYDDCPKWYWQAVRDTLMDDNIIKYAKNIELSDLNEYYDYPIEIEREVEDDYFVELNDIEIYVDSEKLSELPIINACWKLLDRFFVKIEEMNLYYIRLAILHIFTKLYRQYDNKYL